MIDLKLIQYMRENFPWSQFKKTGIFSGLKFNDYEEQAKRICTMFDLEAVYDYSKIGRGTRVHISYANPNEFTPFVETIGEPILKVEGKTAKIIPLNKAGQLKLLL